MSDCSRHRGTRFYGRTRRDKRRRLAGITYEQFLVDALRMDPQLKPLLQNRTCAYMGVGTDAGSALDAFALGLPGFQQMDLGAVPDRLMSASARQSLASTDKYVYHFPDGNAGVVRALLRQLVLPRCPAPAWSRW